MNGMLIHTCVDLNFHPPEVVSRYRDPQLQVGGIYAKLGNSSSASHILGCFKAVILSFKQKKLNDK